MNGVKFDQEKLRYDLLPVEPLEDVVAVLGYGGKKYGDDNWKYVTPFNDRYYAAAFRHLTTWRKGELLDPETGLPHLAHLICCAIFLLAGPGE